MVSALQRYVLSGFFVVGLLTGCEAPLNLQGVEQELAKLVHRYDQFQSIARSGDQLVVVGSAGSVLNSQDAGMSWQRNDIPGRPSLIDVSACPDGRFIALDVARKIWISNAEATNWQYRDLPTPESVLALSCDTQNAYWVVAGFSTILSSDDSGETWNEDSLGDDAQFTTIQFVDSDIGYITGEFGTVLKTVDGGQYWQRMSDIPGEFYPQAARFTDTQHGWVVGLNGAIYHTADGGNSWQSQASKVQIPLYGINSADGNIYAVGENGLVLSYQHGQWQSRAHKKKILSYLRAVAVVDDGLVVAGGSGALFNLGASH